MSVVETAIELEGSEQHVVKGLRESKSEGKIVKNQRGYVFRHTQSTGTKGEDQ